MKKNLDERLKEEIRILKKFLKGIGVYGAEIRVGGFSGYLCELLVLHYRSFIGVLEAMDSFGEKLILDPANFYQRKGELEKLFRSRFIMVDPVDKHRNVASAVAYKKLDELIAASRLFLEIPRIEFFRQEETQPFSPDGVTITIDAKGTDLLFTKIGKVEVVPDVLWGQLYKSVKSIENFLRQNDFQVLRIGAWSDEKEVSILLLELESNILPMTKKHFGPPILRKTESRDFLAKYLGSKELVAGPWIENGRWTAQIRRRYMDARVLLEKRLKAGGRDFGVASLISEAFKRDLEIYVDDEILKFYSSNRDFAVFLTDFLYGRPKWLEPPRDCVS
jgi:tRNA nucleotidyltransferase (CCA-adding enzyme)